MSKTIDFYYSCTNNRLLITFEDNGKFVCFLENGICLYSGTYIHKIIEKCDFYFLDNNFIFAVNSTSGIILLLQQYIKYTYVFSTALYNHKKNLPKKNKRTVSYCITRLLKEGNVSLDLNQLKIIDNNEILFLDYYNENKFNKYFFPSKFTKKLSCVNSLIKKSSNEVISVIDISNSIDLKYLLETHSLENNTILVPNIIRSSSDILPVSFTRNVIETIGCFNEHDSINKTLINLILNAFLKNCFVKTYPSIVKNIRIRGDFDNVTEEEREELLKDVNDNFIFKEKDVASYSSSSESCSLTESNSLS